MIFVFLAKHCFPYVEKRIVVDMVQSFELSPIEVACESMKRSIKDLKAVTVSKQPDMKRLQLKLQGCVGTQVNATFLASINNKMVKNSSKLKMFMIDS